MINIQHPFAICYQAGLAAAVDMMNTAAQGAERLRTQQLEAIAQVLSQNASLATRIRESDKLDDLVAVNAELVGAQIKGIASYWTGLGEVLKQNQKALQDHRQQQWVQIERQFEKALDIGSNGSPGPVVDAVKTLARAAVAGMGSLGRLGEMAEKPVAGSAPNAEAAVRATHAMQKAA